MKPFNLSEWLKDKSRKVVTRLGEPVEIINYEAKGEYCIYAKVICQDKDTFNVCTTANGEACKGEKTIFDLFFADEEPQSIEIPFGAKDSEFIKDEYYIPEGCEARIEGNKVIIEKIQKEKLTEFENYIKSLLEAFGSQEGYRCNLSYESVKKCGKELLDLARKELISIQDTKAYQEGVKEGRRLEREDLEEFIEDKVAEKFAELLKDLQTQSPLQPYPNPFQPTTVLYGCPSTQSDVIYCGTKTQQDNE